jgi:hypothetical protein
MTTVNGPPGKYMPSSTFVLLSSFTFECNIEKGLVLINFLAEYLRRRQFQRVQDYEDNHYFFFPVSLSTGITGLFTSPTHDGARATGGRSFGTAGNASALLSTMESVASACVEVFVS